MVKTLGEVNGTRQIANTLVTLNGLNGSPTTPPNPTINSALLFQALYAQGKVQCGTPAGGAERVRLAIRTWRISA